MWGRWDPLVRRFNHRFVQIAVRVRRERGWFSSHPQHFAREKLSGLERGPGFNRRLPALFLWR